MANPYKNEIEITLGEAGKKYTLRPTFKALIAIEEEVGKSIPEVIRDANDGIFKISYIPSILKHGIEAAGGSITDEEIETAIEEDGINKTADHCVSFILNALSGSKHSKKNSP
jgi:hypothetical protein